MGTSLLVNSTTFQHSYLLTFPPSGLSYFPPSYLRWRVHGPWGASGMSSQPRFHTENHSKNCVFYYYYYYYYYYCFSATTTTSIFEGNKKNVPNAIPRVGP